jgi:YggT family protein
MQNALLFVFRTLFELYVLTFAVRLLLQWARVDSRNPIVQFILRVTNPLVVPLRKLLPPLGRIDTATAVALVGLQLLGTALLVRIGCVGEPGALQILLLTLLGIANLALRIYFWAILIYVILSWVSPGGYNPGAALVSALAEPVLAPFRRLIPLIGGLDLSPVLALIALQAITLLLPTEQVLGGMLCTGIVAAAF